MNSPEQERFGPNMRCSARSIDHQSISPQTALKEGEGPKP